MVAFETSKINKLQEPPKLLSSHPVRVPASPGQPGLKITQLKIISNFVI